MWIPELIGALFPLFLKPDRTMDPDGLQTVFSPAKLPSTSPSDVKYFRVVQAHATRPDRSMELLFHNATFTSRLPPSIRDRFSPEDNSFGPDTVTAPFHSLHDPFADPSINKAEALEAWTRSRKSSSEDPECPRAIIRTTRIPMMRPKFKELIIDRRSGKLTVVDSNRVRNLMEWSKLHRQRHRFKHKQPKHRQGTHGIVYPNSTDSSSKPVLRSDETVDGIFVEWVEESVEAPDITDRETLISIAKLTSDAYYTPESRDWYPLDDFNNTMPFGWEKNADGLRGHVFADDTNTTVIISIKGTSAGLLGSGGPTAKNDKFNDNLLFSCCCAHVDFSWSTVCDCFRSGWKCEQQCLESSIVDESAYTTVGPNLYNNVTSLYPNATNIWLVGHSLGGSLSSLIGISYGSPAVTFEAPGERMAASRLSLPIPEDFPMNKSGITHVYHNADPIPMGICNGPTSGCYAGGFAMESRCHMGQSIIYDSVAKLGWAVDIRTHRIWDIINHLLAEDWEPAPNDTDVKIALANEQRDNVDSINAWCWGWPGWGGGGNKTVTATTTTTSTNMPPSTTTASTSATTSPSATPTKNPRAVPKAEPEDECVDCSRWEFGHFPREDPTTTSTISVAPYAPTALSH